MSLSLSKGAGAGAREGAGSAEDEGPARLSSVAMAFRFLKSFSEDEVELGVTVLARRLGVAKSTVHRLATTMVAEGVLEQNPDNERYRLGLGLFKLGALVRRRMSLSNEARPHLHELRETTHETVHLAVMNDDQIMYVHNLESMHAIRMRSDIGIRKPAHCTAEGMAILAFLSDPLIEALVAQGLTPRTPKTDTDPGRFRAELLRVRQRGYAFEDEASELGMRCVAAPIRDASGEVVAAVGVAGPVQRLSKKVVTGFAPHVIRTAQAISARLGWQPVTGAMGATGTTAPRP